MTLESPMIEIAAHTHSEPQHRSSLDALARAYASGDAPLGELLIAQALDQGLPWDQVCAAAARGTAQRYGELDRD
jgi:hypothetical protein